MSQHHNFRANHSARMRYVQNAALFKGSALPLRFKFGVLRTFTITETEPRRNCWKATSNYCGISKQTIQRILKEFEDHNELREHDGQHHGDGTHPGPQPILQTNSLMALRVKQLVHARQMRDQATLSHDVVTEVLSKFGMANVPLRSVRRFLRRLDLVCTDEANDGLHDEWHEKFEVRLDRYNFLCLVQEAVLQARPVCYVDETFVYERPTCDRKSYIDKRYRWAGRKKGRRLNVVGAVTDSGDILKSALFMFENHRWNGDHLQLFPDYIDRLMHEFAPNAETSESSNDPLPQSPSAQAQSAELHDDFKQWFMCYFDADDVDSEISDAANASTSTTRKRRRRSASSVTSLEDVFLSHIEYCIWTMTLLPADQVCLFRCLRAGVQTASVCEFFVACL